MSGQALELECAVCKHRFATIPDEEALKKMAIYCPKCNIEITLVFLNTTSGMGVVGFIKNSVINEHIAKMKDKDWKKDRGLI